MYTTSLSSIFFFNDPAPTEIYTLSLHDALPIYCSPALGTAISTSFLRSRIGIGAWFQSRTSPSVQAATIEWKGTDRKSTRLNSSHGYISYAVFCLKKKKKKKKTMS